MTRSYLDRARRLFFPLLLGAAAAATPLQAQTISSAANQVFTVGQASAASAVITVSNGAVPAAITSAKDIRIRIPSTFNMSWLTSVANVTIGGSAAAKVSGVLLPYEDGGKTVVVNVTTNFAAGDQITITGLRFTDFAAPSAAANLELELGNDGLVTATDNRTITINPGATPNILSAANQVFAVGGPLTAISPITITDAAPPQITAAAATGDIRIRIPVTFNMSWDTSDTTAVIGGPAAAKVSTTVTYEDVGKTLVLNVTANFAAGDSIVVSGLSFMSFTAPSPADSLQLEVKNDNVVTDVDAKTITITAFADLVVTKTASPPYPTAVPVGTNVTYTITVTNNGPSPATGVRVIDTMPPGVFYVSASGGSFTCTAPPASVVTCNLTLPSLAPSTSQSFMITGRATAPGVQTNKATPTANEPDPVPGNDLGMADTLVTVPGTAVLYPTVRSTGVAASVNPGNQNFLEWLNPGGPASQITIHRTTATGSAPCPYETNSGNAGTLLAAATRPFVANKKEFFLDDNGGGGLTNFTTYCYTIFVDLASPRFISGRPFDAVNGAAFWAFNMGTWSMAPPGNGVGIVHAVANDNVLYAMTKGAAGGMWPGPSPQWLPFGFMNGPSQGRPSTYPLPVGTANSAVFLTSQDGNVYAIDAQLGGAASPAWLPSLIGTSATAHPSALLSVFGGPAGFDLIFVGSRETPPAGSKFFGLRLSDGTTGPPGWSQPAGGVNGKIGPVHGQAAVDYFTSPPRVYFATRANGVAPDNNTLWCLNAETGAVLWAKPYGDIDAGVSLRGNRLYVATNSGTVQAVDTSTGNPAWTVSGPFVIAPAAEGPAKGFVYAPPGGNELFFASKSRIWSLGDGPTSYVDNWLGGVLMNSPATPIKVPGETVVYVGSGDGTLHRRDAATGALVDLYFLGDFNFNSSAVGSPTFDLRNSFIYVGTEAGIVYVLNKASLLFGQCVVNCLGYPDGQPCSSVGPPCACICFGGVCLGGC